MAPEGMHHVLLGYLRQKGAVQFVIDAWESAWYQAQRFPDEPLPCPECFLDGSLQRLELLPSVGPLVVARCEACRIKFEFSGP